MGLGEKTEQVERTPGTAEDNGREGIVIIDDSQYQPKKVPHLTWCECIKKTWQDDPFSLSRVHGTYENNRVHSRGTDHSQILKHLGLWEESARDPSPKANTPEIVWIPVEDTGWAVLDQPDIVSWHFPCHERVCEDRAVFFWFLE